MRKKPILFVSIIGLLVIGCSLFIFTHHAAAPQQRDSSAATGDATSTSSFDKTQYSLTDPASVWVVVNKQHPLAPKDYAPTDLQNVGSGQYMRAEAAQALQHMLADAKTAGLFVTPASGYRSYTTQVSVYNSEVKSNGQAVADSESARPGYSEHQTGWAIDLASGGCSITDCFANTPGGKWVTANAYKYGFLLRYTPGNENVT